MKRLMRKDFLMENSMGAQTQSKKTNERELGRIIRKALPIFQRLICSILFQGIHCEISQSWRVLYDDELVMC